MRSDMDNDPSASRSYDRNPTDEMEEELDDMEEYASNFFDEENLDVDIQSQEFSALNNQLDQLQSALDMLESRNADIHQELLQLLQSNREVRRCLTEELAMTSDNQAEENHEAGGSAGAADGSNCDAPVECPGGSSNAAPEVSLIHAIETIKLEKCGSAN